jgi:hypothetical protein
MTSSNNAETITHELVGAVAAGDGDRVFALAKRLVGGTYAIISEVASVGGHERVLEFCYSKEMPNG